MPENPVMQKFVDPMATSHHHQLVSEHENTTCQESQNEEKERRSLFWRRRTRMMRRPRNVHQLHLHARVQQQTLDLLRQLDRIRDVHLSVNDHGRDRSHSGGLRRGEGAAVGEEGEKGVVAVVEFVGAPILDTLYGGEVDEAKWKN